jgi:hypothetical protein
MKYSTPELQLVGTAQGLVLGASQIGCFVETSDNPGGLSRPTPEF